MLFALTYRVLLKKEKEILIFIIGDINILMI